MLNEFSGMYQKHVIVGSSDDVTRAYRIPISGKATYIGVGAYKPTSTPARQTVPFIGKATMTADFRAGKITGKVRDFIAAPGHTTTGGALDVDSNITDNYSLGRITGNLNLDGRNRKIDDRAVGVFYGNDADAVSIVSGVNVNSSKPHVIAIIAEK